MEKPLTDGACAVGQFRMQTEEKEPLKLGAKYCFELSAALLRAINKHEAAQPGQASIDKASRQELLSKFSSKNYEPGLTDEIINSWLYRYKVQKDLSQVSQDLEKELRKELPLRLGEPLAQQVRAGQIPQDKLDMLYDAV